MMKEKVRKEWKQYLFEEGKEYTLEEAIQKVKDAVMFLKSRNMRISENMFLDAKKYELEFRLSEESKNKYIKEFLEEGYTKESSITIVKVMDVIYHTFDVTEDKAFEMAKYAANNRLTLVQTIKDKLYVDFEEMEEFTNTVFSEIVNYFLSRTVKCGEDLIEIINEILSTLE